MAQPKPEDLKLYKDTYDKILFAAKGKPVALEGEKKGDKELGFLLDEKLFMGLLTAIPYNDNPKKDRRNLMDVPIGGMEGWLNENAKEPMVKAFKSVPIDQKYGTTKQANYCGILTYQGCFILWRHAQHYSHDPRGGGPDTGKYDAIEGFKLTGDIAKPYVDKAKLKAPDDKWESPLSLPDT
jgi:hypothetical protein